MLRQRAVRKTIRAHPTAKPLALVLRVVRNSSRPGDIVFDCFGGSSTTLLACDKAWRRCRIAEIDPRYCEAISHRWEEQTGKRARRAMIGMTRNTDHDSQ